MRPGDESGGASTSASGDDGHLLRLLRSSEDDPDGVLRWLVEICRAVSESTEGGSDAGPADGNDADLDATEERRARLEALVVRARALFETWQRARAPGTSGGDGTRPTENPNCLTLADAASSLVRFRERCAADEWSSAAATRLQALAPPEAVVKATAGAWKIAASKAGRVAADGVAAGLTAGLTAGARVLETSVVGVASGVASGVAGLRSGVFVVTDAVTDGMGVGVQAASEGIRDVGRLTKSTVGGLGGLASGAALFGARRDDDADDILDDMRAVLTEREAVETKSE